MEKLHIRGLSDEDVVKRVESGKKNTLQKTISKSKKQIYKENICTLFNLLNVLIAIALACVGAWTNLVFIVIIITNVMIGIIQELHAKKLVDELSLLMIPQASVVRNGKIVKIPVEDIVLDDILMLDSGQQICCDAIVIDGEAEVNEALLTGESDPIHKVKDSELLSGSSIISGKCFAKVIHVGNDNYAAKVANEVKQIKQVHSELLDSMRKVTKVTSFMIIPLGIILFVEAYMMREQVLFDAVVSSAAGLLGMLPKGLVLLISVSLAAGVSKLAKHKILIQDLYSLETLAHVDTLCLDKTGTITSGKMQVERVIALQNQIQKDLDMFSSYLYYSDDNNATQQALYAYFQKNEQNKPIEKISFSSVRKWGAMKFSNYGYLILGAPDRMMEQLPLEIVQEMEQGNRVLVLAKAENISKDATLVNTVTPIAAIVLSDIIRHDVDKTMAYFRNEGVDIKIISGDHVSAVSAIAKKAGVVGYEKYIDLSKVQDDEVQVYEQLVDQYTVFGRVTPKQKKLLVQALQNKQHVVAMTGDGVNDMLALKEADCSIAVAEGSEAVKQMSSIVLLNSDFAYLPQVLLEGRRVVNNVTRVASVFFIKTIYSIILSILCALGNFSFPFIPIQITLIDMAIEAFPSFITLLEPNSKKVTNTFLKTVMSIAIPNGIAIVACIVGFMLLQNQLHIDQEQLQTMMYLCVAFISMKAVVVSSIPFNPLRLAVCVCMIVGFIFALIIFPSLLHLAALTTRQIVLVAIMILLGFMLQMLLHLVIEKKLKNYKETL